MTSKISEKKTERISKAQKQKMVEYMCSHLEFARGQFGGINGNTSSKDEWESLRSILNSMGGSGKSVEQWKKCWIELKSGVKKRINARRSFMNKTGGGSWVDVPRDLNPLEEQILQVITVDAVDGDSRTPESGIIIQELETTIDESSDESVCLVEFLEDEEICPSQVKKQKIELSKTSKATLEKQNKIPTNTPAITKLSICTEALNKSNQKPQNLSTNTSSKYTKNLGIQNHTPPNRLLPTTSSKYNEPSEKRKLTPPSKSSTTTASKYSEALVEAREMQTVILKEFEKLRNQNNIILNKICGIEQILNAKANNP